jgi:fructoselysine 6-kinase
MNSRVSLVFIGDLTVDTYPKSGVHKPAGASLNGAVWAKRFGVSRVSVIAPVGTDDAGRTILTALAEQGIDADGVSVVHGHTSSIEILVDKKGEHSWGEWSPGVLAGFHFSPEIYRRLAGYDGASLTIYGKTRHLLEEFARSGARGAKQTFLSVNFDDLSQLGGTPDSVSAVIRDIDAGFFGLHGTRDTALIRELRRLSMETGKLLVITLGRKGAVAFCGNTSIESSAVRVPQSAIKDTTGAGDAFLAGFLSEYLRDRNIIRSLRTGNDLAARKIKLFGAY